MKTVTHAPADPRPAGVGTRVAHESAAQHVTGEALYTHDLATRDKSSLHAWPVQSAHAHALVTKLNTDEARKVPGVVEILTADDVPGLNDAR
ncbi:MAG: xanthine dehydrogenase molybdopterin binding subunit, partial [Kocuria sp.]|nr:xanthine dehydrogenase molybdopterin binding subunit [Kocuria sp.]